ncbi:hypothetical protein [Gorillibacterium sp. sgz5001074]|uniref:hypothetical protein n=1 Tax=Gorillibacterium sp. sgz5001074 TaxID=3446695 RepID=UPI003F67FCC7
MQPDYDLAKGWWYAALLASILIPIVIFMPKRLKLHEIYATIAVIGYVVWFVDINLAIPFDIFDIGSQGKQGLPELLLYGVIPPCLSVIYLNFYKPDHKWKLAIPFFIGSFLLEWLTVQVGLMTLKTYNTLYSLPVHFLAYAYLLPWHLRFIRRGR